MKCVALTEADKKKFAEETKKLTAPEFVQLTHELEAIKERFSKEDWRYMTSHLGRRAERLLRNAVKNFSFEDR